MPKYSRQEALDHLCLSIELFNGELHHAAPFRNLDTSEEEQEYYGTAAQAILDVMEHFGVSKQDQAVILQNAYYDRLK